MEVFIARQPIFNREMEVYGYELLYRNNDRENVFAGIEDDQATAELIYNSFLVVGLKKLTDGKKAFINFSKELVDSNVATLLPNQDIVVEVLERDRVTESTEAACMYLHDNGYIVALDDVCDETEILSLLQYANIVKIEFNIMPKTEQLHLMKKYKGHLRFLAEKIETREQFQTAFAMGYDYFQGFFFSKPTIIKQKDISSMNANLFEIFEELNSDSPNYLVISDIIQRDLGLTYKLLMLVNTIKFEAKRPIRSVRYALTFLGINEIFQWVSLIMIKDLQNSENAEMIKLSMIRAKLMELIARELNLHDRESEYFLVGIFSFIDVILDREMKEVLSELPLSATIKNALTDRSTQMGRTLDFLIAYEKTDWENVIGKYPLNLIEDERFLLIYMEALGWAVQMSAQYSI